MLELFIMVFPVVEEIEFLDPAKAFGHFAEEPFALFFDSSLQNERQGRYAFIARDPFLTIASKNKSIAVDALHPAAEKSVTKPVTSFDALQDILGRYTQKQHESLPPFQGGAAGYFGYDLYKEVEPTVARPGIDDMIYPDMAVGIYDTVISFDLQQRRAWIISSGYPETDLRKRRRRATQRVEELKAQLITVRPQHYSPPVSLEWVSNFTPSQYKKSAQRVIDYIWAGDIFQANLSQRFKAGLPEDFSAFSHYLKLRHINPASFSGYQNFGEFQIVSSSPERFLKVTQGEVETRPIKGTRPRGQNRREDLELIEDLQICQKDRSENAMIVDLLRNDMSRVCKEHSMIVPELCAVETYATLHHLVSTVYCELQDDKNAVDLLKACFPGGSITGAPKVRAMEIISELEPTQRGPYCGSMGYIGFDGTMDTNIVIRTLLFKDDIVTFQVGGGIVADSDKTAEYEETMTKAKALFASFEVDLDLAEAA